MSNMVQRKTKLSYVFFCRIRKRQFAEMKISSNPKQNNNLLLKETFKLGSLVMIYCDELIEKRQFAIGDQILRCGTSVVAKSREAQNAASKKDFVHKLKISIKESEELDYWMPLLESKKHNTMNTEIIRQNLVCTKILNSIISKSMKGF